LGLDASRDLTFKIYPQPFQNGMLSIESNWINSGNVQVQLLDITGRLTYQSVQQASSGKLSFQLENQAPGIYIIKLQQDQKQSAQRLIISASEPGSN
jgi:hypothetical protein